MGFLPFRAPKLVAAALVGAIAGAALWAVLHSWRIQRVARQAAIAAERELPKSTPSPREEDRVPPARARVESPLRRMCRAAELPYPPRELFLRAFKREAEMEVWARGDA